MSKKNRNKRNRTFSILKEHQRVGKTLKPPLAQVPLNLFDWRRDLLPEMLWLDVMLADRDLRDAAILSQAIMDLLDQFVPEDSKEVFTGLVSSFELIPLEKQGEALKAVEGFDGYELAFPVSFRHAMSLYAECPMGWLFEGWRQNTHVDFEIGLSHVKQAVRRLYPSRGKHSTRCRMAALSRLFKRGRIHITPGATRIAELLPRYSDGMPEEQQRETESLSRAMFGAVFELTNPTSSAWVQYFWRHNYEISGCEFGETMASAGTRETGDLSSQKEIILKVVKNLRQGLSELKETYGKAVLKAKLDLYDLDRDEVLFGLVSRQFRMFSAIADDPRLWIPDVGLMFHRIMADTVIVITWLVHKNDPALFKRFKEYSLGKQKLYKLQLHDVAERMGGDSSLNEMKDALTEQINEEFWEEVLPIDLGSVFEHMDTYKMAQECGLRDLYNLVYSPTSSELHGEWANLKDYHLVRCVNPLHRFHRLPKLESEYVLVPKIVLTASSLLADTIRAWLKAYNLQTEYMPIIDAFTREVVPKALNPSAG